MIAVTRAVSPTLDRCQLVHMDRTPIDVDRASRQHEAYERLLEGLGCTIERAAAAPELPDGVFVEDAAVVVPEVAIMTRPGAESRRPEIASVAAVLERHRPVRYLERPATLDGGDVLCLGRRIWVGRSARTNAAGADQLRRILEPLGYDVRRVDVTGCLHLKTAVTGVADGTLLVNPEWVDVGSFPGLDRVEVDPAEPHAANALRVRADEPPGSGENAGPDPAGFGRTARAVAPVIVAAAHPRTRERLEAAGIPTAAVDVSELAKAEAGVTCCSILLA